jgi:hypothetical protein
MSVARRLGWDALSIFLRTMDQQRAHWYVILSPAASCNLDDRHCLAFPSLSKLTSVDEEIIREVLCQCGLAWYRSNTGYSVMPMAWAEFVREYQLEEVEVSHFFIMLKKRIYIRLRSWQDGRKKTPAEVWSNALNDSIYAPRLRISSLGNDFTKNIGAGAVKVACNLLDHNHFPLLHSLFSNHAKHGIMDQLLKEVIKFHGSNVLKYRKGNNTEGTLINLPSYRSLKNYGKYLIKSTSPMATLVNVIAENSKCSAD